MDQSKQINCCKMKLHGSHVVMICCFLLQFSNIAQKRYFFSLTPYFGILIVVCSQGLLFLLYPLLGHLADVYLTRYRTLKCGLVIVVTGELVAIICTVIAAAPISVTYSSVAVLALIIAAIMVIGVGLFEANAIQFGLDQLLEAPTSKLITFIHWYYWSQKVGGLLVFYITYSGYFTLQVIQSLHKQSWEKISFIGLSMVLSLVTVSILVLFCVHRKHFYIQRAGLINPFKNIYKVLRYAWKHKVPEHRSAFTYWEEDIPPRIDLGKNKYGGPFTNEEVEDTKTFLRILPLLLCLFGYHVAGDGYSAPEQLQRISCPSLPVFLLIVVNPLHMSALVTVVGIPLYRLVFMKIFPRVKFLMLTKMWIGLYLSLLQQVVYIIVVLNDYSYTHDQEHCIQNKFKFSFSRYCFHIRIVHNVSNSVTCLAVEDLVDNTYLWFTIPQLLNGLSSMLVCMTVFEFICAQAPRTTQGLLIGLWYATFSIRYLVVGVLDSYITERKSWLICEGVKGFIILVSLVLFSCVSGHYRYRERDEIVNVQGMIEEIHERQLDQEEEYMQERREFYQNERANNTRPQPYS